MKYEKELAEIDFKNQRKDILLGEVHNSANTLWINSAEKCEVRINHIERFNGMTPIKCRICKDGGLIDITLE